MYRPRLKSARGCIRCKQRHKKCDEERPRCGFCTRWNLPCSYLSTGVNETRSRSEEPRRQPPTTSPPGHPNQNITAPASRALILYDPLSSGAFQHLPIPFGRHSPRLQGLLHQFFGSMIPDALPFDNQAACVDLGQQWLQAVLTDELVCVSLLAYCLKFQWNETRDPQTHVLGVAFEKYMVQVLWTRLERHRRVPDAVIFAANNHLMSAALDEGDQSRMQRIRRGVRTLALSRGTVQDFMAHTSPGVMQAVVTGDFVLNCMLATKPTFEQIARPVCPHSMVAVRDDIAPNRHVAEWTTELDEIMKDLRLLFLFRRPCRHEAQLSLVDCWYLLSLLQYVDVRLVALQAQHVASTSCTKIVVLAAVLIRLTVLSDGCKHVKLISVVLQRLLDGLETGSYMSETLRSPRLACWVSSVALVCSKRAPESNFFFNIFMRSCQSLGWVVSVLAAPKLLRDLSMVLHKFPWHAKADVLLYNAVRGLLIPSVLEEN